MAGKLDNFVIDLQPYFSPFYLFLTIVDTGKLPIGFNRKPVWKDLETHKIQQVQDTTHMHLG